MTFLKKTLKYVFSLNFLLNVGAIILVYVVVLWAFRSCLNSSTNHGQKIEVPNLIGKNSKNVANILGDSGLEYVVVDSIYDPKKIEGTVIGQDPLPTKETSVYVKAGRKLKISVSKRNQLVEMPDLVDKSQRFAEAILRNRGFRYRLEYKPTQEAHGAVLSQLYKNKPINKGARIPIGSTIKLIVGRSEVGVPQPLPNLYGLTIEEAKQRVGGMLNMEFLVSTSDGYTKADSLVARVVSQSPEWMEGAQVASGTTIQVFATKEFQEQQPE